LPFPLLLFLAFLAFWRFIWDAGENGCRAAESRLERCWTQQLEITTMPRNALYLSVLTLFLVSAPLVAEPAGDCFFHKGDRIVFLGDSITMVLTV
jgi:hypothetical protein